MLKNKIAKGLAAVGLAVGMGVTLAGPAAAENPNKYVLRNAVNEDGGIGGNIATRTSLNGQEYTWRPYYWGSFDEGSSSLPRFVMAGGGYCVLETVRIAKNTDPNNREWYIKVQVVHGGRSSRQAWDMAGPAYLSSRSESVESRLTVFRCS